MPEVTLAGRPISIEGAFPVVGQTAPAFTLTGQNLADLTLAHFAGKRKLLNIIPSLDTPICAASTRKFNEAASQFSNTVVLVISSDLPFAAARFCTTEGIDNVVTLSTFRHSEFARQYGVCIASGPLIGLTARAVIALDEHDKVLYAELVSEIKSAPDYDAALAVLQSETTSV